MCREELHKHDGFLKDNIEYDACIHIESCVFKNESKSEREREKKIEAEKVHCKLRCSTRELGRRRVSDRECKKREKYIKKNRKRDKRKKSRQRKLTILRMRFSASWRTIPIEALTETERAGERFL